MVSKFQKVVNFLYRRFVQEMGREPATTKEIMDIQDEAVRHFNKTKGVPQGAPKPSFQGFKPTVIEGGKSKEGIGTLLEDSPEAIAKMKADNKAAAERLRKKKEEEELFKDFRPPKDPEFASGGLARVGMVGGGPVWKKFIEQLFMKSSNNIRQGKGLFKGLNQEQMITQHDNLTKMLKKWEMSGKKGLPEGAEQYLGMNDLQVSKAIKDATKKVKKVDKNRKLTDEEWKDYVEENSYELSRYEEELTGNETIAQLDDMIAESRAYEADMFQQYKRGELEKYVKPEVLEESRLLRQKKIDKVLDKAYDEIAGGSGFSDDYKMAADELSDSIAEQLGKNFDDLSQTQQTQIQNIALKRTTQDLKKRLSQPTKTLEGIKKEGTIDISDPEVADEFSRFMKESDPEGFKDLEQKIQLSDFDVKGRKKNASGGRASSGLNYLLGEDDQNVRMPSGGLPGLLGE